MHRPHVRDFIWNINMHWAIKQITELGYSYSYYLFIIYLAILIVLSNKLYIFRVTDHLL